MKSGKQDITNETELPNQGKIRTVGEKETFKYLRILEVDIIKQVKMKEKLKESRENQKNYSRQNYIAGTLPKR